MATLAEPQEVENFLGKTLNEQQLSRVDLLLELATAKVQARLHQNIFLETTTGLVLPGTWSKTLTLPEWPVVSVAAVSLNGQTLEETTGGWRASSRGLVRSRPTSEIPNAGFASPGGARRYGDPNWGGPDSLVEVTYTHGFSTVPTLLKGIAIEMVATTFSVRPGVVEESIEDWSAKYDVALDAHQGLLDAFPKPW